MDTFNSVEEILDYAISNEEESFEFYSYLAEQIDNPELKRILNTFAHEEEAHKKKLIMAKKGIINLIPDKNIIDLNKNDYLVADSAHPKMDTSDALRLAIKKEKAVFNLYLTMAQHTYDEKYRKMFILLAQEEAKHKEKFEDELGKL